MGGLDQIGRWPGRHAAQVLVRTPRGAEVTASWGPTGVLFEYASVSKVAAALAVLVEVDAGRCGLHDAAGPPGATLAHLLSHAAGLPLDGATPLAPPGTRRIYSNTGIDLAVDHAATRAGATATELLDDNVFDRLGMRATSLEGRASSGVVGPADELGALAAELLVPTLLTESLADAQRSVTFPGLAGVLPGFGRHDPCDWGLGVEVKGSKQPHWTGRRWPAATFGHFGQSGGFVAIDLARGLAVVTLGDAPFGPWSVAAWPTFTDEVSELADAARGAGSTTPGQG